MDLKKLAFSDQFSQYASSPRKKVVSGFGLGVAATFIVASVLFLNSSFKTPFFAPVFQGLNSLSHRNSNSTSSSSGSSLAWPFSFSSFSNNASSGDTNSMESQGRKGDFADTHFGNFSENLKNGSFGSEENGSQIDKSMNASSGDTNLMNSQGRTGDFVDAHFGNLTENLKNGSFGSEEERAWNNAHELNGSQIDKGMNFTNVIVKGSVLQSNVTGSYLENGKNESIPVEGQNGISNQSKNVVIDNKGSFFVVENGTNAQNGSELLRNSRSFYRDCDIYDGEWVRDDTKPYYQPGSCPYIDRDFDCHLNKRPDDAYVKWKWKPYACDIPSFNATDFLERLRGQSLVFVGDSLNRNMWESLGCMLRASVKNKKRVFEISGKSEFKKKGFYAFRFEDYNCSVDFVGSPFLVRESSFKGINGSFETLRLDLMDPTTSMYNDADIIIFNTGHWWTHEKTSRGEDYYQEGNHVHGRLKVLEAYKRALYTWARWVDKNIDANRTQVIYRGYSVTHFRGGPWNAGGQCHNETEPIFNKKHLAKYPSKMKVLEHVLHDMRTPVIYMNISRLTDYRKDAHPSIYRPDGQSSIHAQDCSHWCLPGAPDTWNELLYASLLKSGRGSWRI